VVNLFDAHVLLFPVHSMAGPVWVTTPGRLREAGFDLPAGLPDIPLGGGLYTWARTDALNLGWLMIDAGPQVAVPAPAPWRDAERWQAVEGRIVLVQEALFGQAVNSNLEVRTSVSIDPERGAAEDGALFTYEALPRATFLVGEVVLDDYRGGEPFPVAQTKGGGELPGGPWQGPLDVVRAGLRLMEWLGVGGMGTRGFGRMALVGEPVEEEWQ
jgi:CRISPR-associated protein Cmr4